MENDLLKNLYEKLGQKEKEIADDPVLIEEKQPEKTKWPIDYVELNKNSKKDIVSKLAFLIGVNKSSFERYTPLKSK